MSKEVKKPKYHYIQVVGLWDRVMDYVNNHGYEIHTMCSIRTKDGDTLVYLLRRELNDEPKEIM